MRFRHHMPFGAELREDGSVRFRLWAPKPAAVSLVLEDQARVLPMERLEGGWFELVTDQASAGTRYRFQIADGVRVPDPASRGQAGDVHDPSVVVDPRAYAWQSAQWKGRSWHEAVIYEAHVGTFSPDGTFDGMRRRLDHLANLGVTVVQLMPVADFRGRRNWGYDGVLPFAPDTAYGSPDDLKRLIDEAHGRDLMVFLDVVYNHFGPEGNYVHLYAPEFLTRRHSTPWGAAIDFGKRTVRDFFVENALFWLEEYRFDGLRLDAVDVIHDEGGEHILFEIAARVRARLSPERQVHLTLENYANQARYLERDEEGAPRHHTAQWNDDAHHVLHGLLTGETAGYYQDYATHGHDQLARSLANGYVFQGEASLYNRGMRRGEVCNHLPPLAFINCLQNHDQVGNRPFGERLASLTPAEALRAATTLLLLAPQVPLLFMGEEWGCERPFLFFTDFEGDLANNVRRGRFREFQHFGWFSGAMPRADIPDPNDPNTFQRSRLDWDGLDDTSRRQWLDFHGDLLKLRRESLVPRLAGMRGNGTHMDRWGAAGVTVWWTLGDGSQLTLFANLAKHESHGCRHRPGPTLHATHPNLANEVAAGAMPPWSVLWCLAEARK